MIKVFCTQSGFTMKNKLFTVARVNAALSVSAPKIPFWMRVYARIVQMAQSAKLCHTVLRTASVYLGNYILTHRTLRVSPVRPRRFTMAGVRPVVQGVPRQKCRCLTALVHTTIAASIPRYFRAPSAHCHGIEAVQNVRPSDYGLTRSKRRTSLVVSCP